ncbi:MAG: pyridoxal phosphate-dependent aminotransferase [Candidatus Xenobia bacterium]
MDEFISARMGQIRGSGIRRAFDVASRMKDVISLGLGEPDFDTPAPIKQAAIDAINNGFNRYTPNAGLLEVRQAIGRKLLAENGVGYDPESEIIVTVGAINALSLSILTLVDVGDEVIIPDPAFVAFEPCVITAGGIPVKVPLREEHRFHMRAEDIEKLITPRTRMLIVNTPQNPTGAVLSAPELQEIANLAEKYNLFVISDEVYEKLIYPGSHHVSIASLPGMRERTVVVNSFSKTYCICGWRIGFAASKKSIIEQMVKLQQFHAVHAPSPAQRAVLAALNGPQEWIGEMVAEYDRRRRYMVQRLNEMEVVSCVMPEGAFYIFLNIGKLGRGSEDVMTELLTEAHVATVPGSALGPCGEGFLRISYTAPIPVLAEAANRMEPVLRRLAKQS